jgi:hypothetical protein
MDVDHNCKIANKRLWLDQITLPLTIARRGSTGHVLHYHRCRFLDAAPQWPGIRDDFFALLPQSDHALATEGLRTLGLNV